MSGTEIVTPSREVLDFIQDEGGDILKLSYQCSLSGRDRFVTITSEMTEQISKLELLPYKNGGNNG